MPARMHKFAPHSLSPALQQKAAQQQLAVPGDDDVFWPQVIHTDNSGPPSGHRLVLWTLLGLVAVLIGWAAIGEIDVVATAPGKVIPEGRVKVLQAADSAIVRAIHVREGQIVREGDLLVELDPTINAAEHKTISEKLILAQLELERLKAELGSREPSLDIPGALPDLVALQHALLASQRASHAARVAQARSERQHRVMLEDAARATLRKLEETSATAREREERARAHVGQVVAHFDYLQLKDSLSNHLSELVKQRSALQAAHEERLAAEQRLRLIEAEHRSNLITQISEKSALIAALNGEKAKAIQLLAQKELRAPTDGQVQSLAITTTGGVVTSAQVIASIVPSDTLLVVEAVLSNADIGYVHLGQRVEIKVDTYPFQKYGTLSGSVAWISPDAESRSPASVDPTETQGQSNTVSVPGKSGLMYRVRIKPDQPGIVVKDSLRPIAVGMTVQADIVTDSRRVIDFFLAPIVKYWDEGMKVR